jgi:hypothetical protein
VFFAGRLAWNLITLEPAAEPTAADLAAEAAEVDTWVTEELASDTSAGARDWLAHGENMLFEGDPAAVQGLIDGLYAAGATDVWFIGIERIGSRNVSASIAVELPGDPAARARILRTEADFWQEPEANPDHGQRYLAISFD